MWIPKFRLPILGGNTESTLKKILSGICLRQGWEIDEMEVMPDHVHIFLSFPPTISISEAVQILKGTSSMRLREEAHDQRAT